MKKMGEEMGEDFGDEMEQMMEEAADGGETTDGSDSL
jgi:hypothetical protein